MNPKSDAEELVDLSAAALPSRYAAGDLSPVEVAAASLARIERLDPTINAFCFLDSATTLAEARHSERRWADQAPLGPLDGVPVAVKDTFLTKGWPTRKGSATIDPRGPWTVDAPAVARLRENGAVIVGKTTTPEYAWKATTDSPANGVTRNPWDATRTPGGSSGGSAAALAARMATVALGTDGGGSIRIPAAFCGVVGFKPTFGRVPFWPASPFGGLAHAGPMARTVRDAAILFEVIAQPDWRDTTSLPPLVPGIVDSQRADAEGLRIAYCPGWTVEPERDIAAAVEEAVSRLEALGANVETVDPPFDDPIDAFRVLWNAGAAKALEAVGADVRRQMDPGLKRAAELGATLSALDYLGALEIRADIAARCESLLDSHAVLVTPAMPISPFATGRDVPEAWPNDDWATWTPYTYPFNLTQEPALVVPCGLTGAGLPIGVQLVGRRHADALVLAVGAALEEAIDLGQLEPPDPTGPAPTR
ncbi:MAG: amidase [Actinomycetota bacterium]|nr:amidase [Actinomycetota bacterium]